MLPTGDVLLGYVARMGDLLQIYPRSGTPLRPLGFAAVFASIVTLGWISMPRNRPNPGAIALWVVVVLVFYGRGGNHPCSPARRSDVFSGVDCLKRLCTYVLGGVYVSRYTRWGRKHFNRR